MKNKGFTLIELLVATGIFSMVVITIVGVFTASIKLQDSVLSTKKVIGEINYVMEFLSRNLRMAMKDKTNVCFDPSLINYNYELTHGSEGIKFRNVLTEGECQEIYLEPVSGRIKFSREGVESYLTSSAIEVTKLQFVVSGDGPDSLQPMVTVYLEADSGRAPTIKIQTSISQRNLDVNF